MNYYVIKKNRKDYEIEKFADDVWEIVKEKINKILMVRV